MTSLEVRSPATLALPALQNILNESMDEFWFVWLFEIDLDASTMTTGSGTPTAAPPSTSEEFCTVNWDSVFPAAVDIPITVDGDMVSTAFPSIRCRFRSILAATFCWCFHCGSQDHRIWRSTNLERSWAPTRLRPGAMLLPVLGPRPGSSTPG